MVKIVSGGQSGVDRAALDVAIALGFGYGGWCPKGGWAEDFQDPPGLLTRYPKLEETPTGDPAERTRWNVRDSDAMLILVDSSGLAVSGGTRLAETIAGRLGKPSIVIDVAAPDGAARLSAWLTEVGPAVLGVGGPRESEAPGIYERARWLLMEVLANAGEHLSSGPRTANG
jgi:Circularly permutated YpsA SLOG family